MDRIKINIFIKKLLKFVLLLLTILSCLFGALFIIVAVVKSVSGGFILGGLAIAFALFLNFLRRKLSGKKVKKCSCNMSIAIWSFIILGFACIATIYVIFGPVFLVKSTQDMLFYLSERNNTTQIQATVTAIDETSAVDSGTEYDIYVSYQFNNISYENIYWRTVSTESKYSIGEFVNVNVFNSKPNDILDLGILNYIGWIFPLIITLIPLWVLIMHIPQFIKKSKT